MNNSVNVNDFASIEQLSDEQAMNISGGTTSTTNLKRGKINTKDLKIRIDLPSIPIGSYPGPGLDQGSTPIAKK